MRLASKGFLALLVLVVALTSLGSVAVASDAEQQAQFTAPIMVVNTSFLNVRTGPAVKYSVLITVVGGTQLPVVGVANDRVWYQVSTVVGLGWINSDFVVPRGDFTNVPFVDTSTISALAILPNVPVVIGLPGQGGGGVVTAPVVAPSGGTLVVGTTEFGDPIIISSANERFRATLKVPAADLRVAPGDQNPSIGTIFQEETIDYPIVNSGRDSGNIEWLAIVTPLGTGWVDTGKLNVRLSGVYATVMVIVGDVVGMGDGPGSGSSTLPILTRGTEAFLRNISADSRFIQIELIGGEVGWIPWDSAQQRTGTPTDGLDKNVIASAGVIAGQGGGATTTTAPIIIPAPLTLDTPHIIVNTAYLNIRSGPGAQYTTVATVSGGTELIVLGVARDRVWYLVQGRFGRGWLNNEFVIFRGVYENVPVINTEALLAGELAQPVAIISAPVTLYAAPGTNFGALGTVSAPAELAIVARTADTAWVQINTQIGFGWVLSNQVTLRGDLSRAPVVG
jgi:uncharacterized protein YgiM (DUF1202 family)